MFNQKLSIEKGVIKKISGNIATVEIVRVDLKECKSCGTCVGVDNKSNLLEVNAISGLSIGQQVTLTRRSRSPYESIILLLILPIINLFIGILIGHKISFIYPKSQDIRMLFCGFILFAASIFAVSLYDKKIRNEKQPYHEIKSIDI